MQRNMENILKKLSRQKIILACNDVVGLGLLGDEALDALASNVIPASHNKFSNLFGKNDMRWTAKYNLIIPENMKIVKSFLNLVAHAVLLTEKFPSSLDYTLGYSVLVQSSA